MLSDIEEKLIKDLFALATIPEQTFTYNELMGYMFGLLMTPTAIPKQEWMPVIFLDSEFESYSEGHALGMKQILTQLYDIFKAKKEQGELNFPYDVEEMKEEDLEEIFEWVSGFEEALCLRPDFWEPDAHQDMPEQAQEELFYSMMVIQGLVDIEEAMPFFSKLPDEVFAEMFDTSITDKQDKEMQLIGFLVATLPLSIQTLQGHAEYIAVNLPKTSAPVQLHPALHKKDDATSPKIDTVLKKKGTIIKGNFKR